MEYRNEAVKTTVHGLFPRNMTDTEKKGKPFLDIEFTWREPMILIEKMNKIWMCMFSVSGSERLLWEHIFFLKITFCSIISRLQRTNIPS